MLAECGSSILPVASCFLHAMNQRLLRIELPWSLPALGRNLRWIPRLVARAAARTRGYALSL